MNLKALKKKWPNEPHNLYYKLNWHQSVDLLIEAVYDINFLIAKFETPTISINAPQTHHKGDKQMAMIHKIYSEVDKNTTEWKLEKHVGCLTGKVQGFTLSYRNAKTAGWAIFVDASQSGGKITVRMDQLRRHGVEVGIDM